MKGVCEARLTRSRRSFANRWMFLIEARDVSCAELLVCKRCKARAVAPAATHGSASVTPGPRPRDRRVLNVRRRAQPTPSVPPHHLIPTQTKATTTTTGPPPGTMTSAGLTFKNAAYAYFLYGCAVFFIIFWCAMWALHALALISARSRFTKRQFTLLTHVFFFFFHHLPLLSLSVFFSLSLRLCYVVQTFVDVINRDFFFFLNIPNTYLSP